MEGFLRRRLSDPRYVNTQRAVEEPLPTAQVPWYASSAAPPQAQAQQLHFSKYEASAKKDEGGGEKAKKKQKKDGKDSSSSGSESDGKGGRRKKEKKKKKGRCWTGYKPTPGKEPYAKGSCMKA